MPEPSRAPLFGLVTMELQVNGRPAEGRVEPRKLLLDFLRDDLRLTGTHAGCEHGVCGACTVILDGRTVRSCLTFALQVAGHDVWTVEGMAQGDELSPLQNAFHQQHGLQCGYCTPGMLMSALELLHERSNPNELEIRQAISGNLCRCTGYQNIVKSIRAVADAYQAGAIERAMGDIWPKPERRSSHG